ncbi:sugar transferase [Flagellimonas sp. 2504JD1-5]
MYKNVFKRILDLLVAAIGFFTLLPLFVPLCIILCAINRGNPFFTQQRPGLNEKVFRLIKLKSMNDKKDENGNLLPDEERLTRTGNFIRKTSLDEIPQLLNVIKGDMSLIGPRPLRVHYLPYYTERESIRHSVRPGITGLAQVSGRNAVDWDEKLEFDAQYVDNLSFGFDMKILMKTVVKVFKSSEVILDDTNMVTFDEHRLRQNEQIKENKND